MLKNNYIFIIFCLSLVGFNLSQSATAQEPIDKKEEIPFRVEQLLLLVDFARDTWPLLQGEASWPKDFSGLFQGLRFPLKDKVTTEANHLKAITIIPEHLMKGKVVSATLQHNGWYFSSIDDIDSKKPSWNKIVATKKDEKFLQFGFTW